MSETQDQKLSPELERTSDLLGYVADLISEKSAEHGTETDPFRNLRAAEGWGVDPWVACMVKISQQTTRLQNFATTGTLLSDKTVERTLLEIATAAIVGLALYEEAAFENEMAVFSLDSLPDIGLMLKNLHERLAAVKEQVKDDAPDDDGSKGPDAEHKNHINIAIPEADPIVDRPKEEPREPVEAIANRPEPETRQPIMVSEEVAAGMNAAAVGRAFEPEYVGHEDTGRELDTDPPPGPDLDPELVEAAKGRDTSFIVDQEEEAREPLPEAVELPGPEPQPLDKAEPEAEDDDGTSPENDPLAEAESELNRQSVEIQKVGRHTNGDDTLPPDAYKGIHASDDDTRP